MTSVNSSVFNLFMSDTNTSPPSNLMSKYVIWAVTGLIFLALVLNSVTLGLANTGRLSTFVGHRNKTILTAPNAIDRVDDIFVFTEWNFLNNAASIVYLLLFNVIVQGAHTVMLAYFSIVKEPNQLLQKVFVGLHAAFFVFTLVVSWVCFRLNYRDYTRFQEFSDDYIMELETKSRDNFRENTLNDGKAYRNFVATLVLQGVALFFLSVTILSFFHLLRPFFRNEYVVYTIAEQQPLVYQIVLPTNPTRVHNINNPDPQTNIAQQPSSQQQTAVVTPERTAQAADQSAERNENATQVSNYGSTV